MKESSGAMMTKLVALSVASVLLAACATTPPVSGERLSEIRARAQECMRAHPDVVRYEVDRFGMVTAYYRPTASGAGATEPFFQCLHQPK